MNARVHREEFSEQCECLLDAEGFAVDFVRGKWRIFEHYTDYNPISGGHVRKGKVVRRYDPDAGDREGKPAAFDTKQQAKEYATKWLTRKTKTA